MKNRIVEYDVLRVIVTILVIIGHCGYYSIITPYGGVDYTFLTEPVLSPLYKLLGYMNTLIYTFHMPLYMVLSGALFRVSINGGYTSLKELLSAKARRLLIPFFVVTVLYSVPLKYIAGYYAGSKNVVYDIFMGQLCIQGNTHLWFLAVLFLIFVFIYIFEKVMPDIKAVKFVILFILLFISPAVKIAAISYVMQYSFWFYVGFCFELSREKINKRICRHQALFFIVCAAIFFLFIGVKVINKVYIDDAGGLLVVIKKLADYAATISGCGLTYCASYLLSKTPAAQNKAFYGIRSNTLGLYLYSDPLNYLILSGFVTLLGGAVFTTNMGTAALFLTRLVLTASGAFLISVLLRKLKLKYLY